MLGKIKFFNKDKGFGFIVEDETGNEYFVHATGLENKNNTYYPETKVAFDIQEGKKGKECINVVKI